MDERINRIGALVNASAYDAEATKKYIDGAPHIKHASLRKLYGKLVLQVFDNAKKHKINPIVLDLGAGEGSVTLPFLELGAKVVAVVPLDESNVSTYVFCSGAMIAYKSFLNSPLFGLGLGSLPMSYTRYIPQSKYNMDGNKNDASSLFFRLISETGLLGIQAIQKHCLFKITFTGIIS